MNKTTFENKLREKLRRLDGNFDFLPAYFEVTNRHREQIGYTYNIYLRFNKADAKLLLWFTPSGPFIFINYDGPWIKDLDKLLDAELELRGVIEAEALERRLKEYNELKKGNF